MKVRRGLLGQQLSQFEGLGQDDPRIEETLRAVLADLDRIDQAIASAEASPTRANLERTAARTRPVFRRLNVELKDLYDREEQELFGRSPGR